MKVLAAGLLLVIAALALTAQSVPPVLRIHTRTNVDLVGMLPTALTVNGFIDLNTAAVLGYTPCSGANCQIGFRICQKDTVSKCADFFVSTDAPVEADVYLLTKSGNQAVRATPKLGVLQVNVPISNGVLLNYVGSAE